MQPELGLNWLGEAELSSWSRERFCTNNAALWLTFPPGDGLETRYLPAPIEIS
jgi:hypothetical protein